MKAICFFLISFSLGGWGDKGETNLAANSAPQSKDTIENAGNQGGSLSADDSPLGGGLQTILKLAAERAVEELNEAARNSAAASPEVLGNAISNLKTEEALSICKGGKDAATRYLEVQTRSQIEEKMLPIISRQTANAGATRYFEQIVDLIPKESAGLLGNLASLTDIEIPSGFELDKYVSGKALNRLSATHTAEGSKTRANQAVRSTKLAKSPFDYFQQKVNLGTGSKYRESDGSMVGPAPNASKDAMFRNIIRAATLLSA